MSDTPKPPPYPTGEWMLIDPWFDPKRIPGPFLLATQAGNIVPTVFAKKGRANSLAFMHSIYFLPPPPAAPTHFPNPFDSPPNPKTDNGLHN